MSHIAHTLYSVRDDETEAVASVMRPSPTTEIETRAVGVRPWVGAANHLARVSRDPIDAGDLTPEN